VFKTKQNIDYSCMSTTQICLYLNIYTYFSIQVSLKKFSKEHYRWMSMQHRHSLTKTSE